MQSASILDYVIAYPNRTYDGNMSFVVMFFQFCVFEG